MIPYTEDSKKSSSSFGIFMLLLLSQDSNVERIKNAVIKFFIYFDLTYFKIKNLSKFLCKESCV